MIKIDKSFSPFEVIEGGKEEPVPITKAAPQGPNGKDWLQDIPLHGNFISHGKTNRGSHRDHFGVAQKTPMHVLLYDFTSGMGMSPYNWVNSLKFSQDNILDEILPTTPPQEEGKNVRNHLPVAEPREEHDEHEGPD